MLQAAVRKRDVARAALRAAQRRLTRATEQLHAQAVSSYVAGGTENEMLAVLISSAGDVSATGRTLSYATAVVDHQGEVIDAFNAARRERNRLADRAESAARTATDARDGLAGVAADQEATQTHLMELAAKEDEAARDQELALQQLRGRKIEIEARVVALEKESDSIGILLAAHQAKQKDYKVGSIEFQPPLEDIDLGSGFGMRVHPILRYERLHAGVDLDRAERHSDPGRRQGQGGPRRAEGRLRQLRGDLPRVRHRHGVRAPVAPLGAARRQGRGGRRHRRGRLDRPVDRSPPPLRDPGAGCARRPGELHRPRSRRRSESRRRLTTGPDCASESVERLDRAERLHVVGTALQAEDDRPGAGAGWGHEHLEQPRIRIDVGDVTDLVGHLGEQHEHLVGREREPHGLVVDEGDEAICLGAGGAVWSGGGAVRTTGGGPGAGAATGSAVVSGSDRTR